MADDKLRCIICNEVIPAPTLVCSKPACEEAARAMGADDE
jgi:hypothetical protein